MDLSIRHVTSYAYDPQVDRAGLRLKIFPCSTSSQRVDNWTVTVNDVAVKPMLTDAFGDGEALWFAHEPVDKIEIVAEGQVTLTDTSGVLGKLGRARPGVYLRHSALTEPDEAIREMATAIEGDTLLARMHALNERISEEIKYLKSVTDASTTAAQAFELGAGVCQDKTHIFITAARAMGLPARYVTGYYRSAEEAELETHAWAEVFIDGLGWTGFDPTHCVCPALDHIRLCSGIDAAEAAPIRGHVLGETEEVLEVDVQIMESQTQSQSQQ